MADFLDKLSDAIDARRVDIADQLRPDAAPGEEDLKQLVRDHWAPLPALQSLADWPAFAIDGSVREVSLDNGSYLFVVQALCIGGDGVEEPRADVQILPPATQRSTASRIGDLLQRHHELALACEMAGRMEPGSVLFLDGALYGLLPQLYPLAVEEANSLSDYPEIVLRDYLDLLRTAEERGVRLVAVSKTSREATHCKIWMGALDMDSSVLQDLTDSAMIHRWTERAAGVSVPVVLGSWGFTGGSRELLDRPEVAGSPAVVSFFVRLADFDDALRVDVPACQLDQPVRLADVKGELLDGGVEAVSPVVDALAADYGGLEVYNALLYSVDREVRLQRHHVSEVVLPLIESVVGHEVRPDRSERRF
jgi:hypothetical protein